MPFRLEQLRYFVAVADEGQFTRAARNLHVAQPALSQAISNLESELGVDLLTRHARGVTPTAAGETFLAKARVALAATTDAAMTARSLARAATGTIEFGFLGLPPMVDAPHLFAAFAEAQPEADLSFRGLPYPRGSLASWLADVDVALCHSPTADPEVQVFPLWAERRFVVAPANHPLAPRGELTVAEVLDETYVGSHPAVDPGWAGFWRLDDHRGGGAANVSADRALSLAATIATVASGRAITTVPACQAAILAKILSAVVTIPLCDAHPTVLSLLWRRDVHNPLVQSLAAVAKSLIDGNGDGRSTEQDRGRRLSAVSGRQG
jgi:DNA-binding transcriptional LysR family regulator